MIKRGEVLRTIVPVTDIVEKPGTGHRIGKRESQLLYGESFIVEFERDGWVHGYSGVDGYRGCVRQDCLAERTVSATHFISALSALVYPEPDFKSRPVLNLSFMSRLCAESSIISNGFLWAEGTGWIPEQHISPVSELNEQDTITRIVDTAIMFINSPYRYGGRLAWGLDCSALVQLAFLRCGLRCPRDSDQQSRSIGHSVPVTDPRRGDIIFFPGHVGIMLDEKSVLNASARNMSVAIEPLEKLAESYGQITDLRRTA